MKFSRQSILLMTLLPTPALFGGGGSNLGDPATFYQPPVVSGVISFGAVQAEGARISTRIGQRTYSDAVGAYTLVVDADGRYDLVARLGLNRQEIQMELSGGTPATLNLDLGQPCSIIPWPENETVLTMVNCVTIQNSAAAREE